MRIKSKEKSNSMNYFLKITTKKKQGLNIKEIEVQRMTWKIGWQNANIEEERRKKEMGFGDKSDP